MPKTAVITGASAGIGHAAALYFIKKGYTVYNISRRPAQGINSIAADITDKASVDDAIKHIAAAEGRIDVLVNNAGMGISGSVENTPPEDAHRIFEVNFFGALNAIQSVIPVMRKQGGGTIINVSSAGAPLALPFQAFYSASKSALSALSEALRCELKPFGIKVSSILPGDVKTEFTAKRAKNAADDPSYGDRIAKSVSKMERDEQNGMPPEKIAKAIYKLAQSKNPPVYVVSGAAYKLSVRLSKVLPKRAVTFFIGKIYG
jgi:short-subunit dehydrogenase